MVVAVQRVANCSGLPRQPLAALATVPVQGGWVGRAYGPALPGTRARRARAPQAHSHPLRGTVWAGVGWLEGGLVPSMPRNFRGKSATFGAGSGQVQRSKPLIYSDFLLLYVFVPMSRTCSHAYARARAHAGFFDRDIGARSRDRLVFQDSAVPVVSRKPQPCPETCRLAAADDAQAPLGTSRPRGARAARQGCYWRSSPRYLSLSSGWERLWRSLPV
ncbi:hypothetical protein HMPREF1275_00909 [Propionibacterium sp. KPL1844]|nr:hypothetical protein HMPREF1275_00909 [Propionibacterium sp. KPL1844]